MQLTEITLSEYKLYYTQRDKTKLGYMEGNGHTCMDGACAQKKDMSGKKTYNVFQFSEHTRMTITVNRINGGHKKYLNF